MSSTVMETAAVVLPPELVAAAGETEGMARCYSVPLVIVVAACLFGVMFWRQHGDAMMRTTLDLPPQALAANARDMQLGAEADIGEALLDRLRLDDERVAGIAAAVRDVAALPGYRMILISVAGAPANAASNTSGGLPSEAAQCRSNVRATDDRALSQSRTTAGNSGNPAGHWLGPCSRK